MAPDDRYLVFMGLAPKRIPHYEHWSCPDEIQAMVRRMVETGHITGGYFMSIGSRIPWNIPPDAVKRYLDLCAEVAHR